jgi:6-phosphogluconolactonase (cycloisomerase 2 family)
LYSASGGAGYTYPVNVSYIDAGGGISANSAVYSLLDPAEAVFSLATDRMGKFLFLGGYYIYPLKINQITGKVDGQVLTTPIMDGVVLSLAAYPTGNFVYAMIQNKEIIAYSVDQRSGGLTFVASYPLSATSNGAAGLAITPSGKYLFAIAAGLQTNDSALQAYSINSSTGELTFLNAYGDRATGVTVSPTGKNLYTVSSAEVTAYSLDDSTGSLSMIGRYPNNGGYGALQLVIDPLNQYAYVPNPNSFTGNPYGRAISIFKINQSDGSLSVQTPLQVTPTPHYMALTPTQN